MRAVLAEDFNTLHKLSQKQFAKSLGLHLNSKDWKAFIDPGQAKFYNFLLNGIVKTTTVTKTDNEEYKQIIQFRDYKILENSLLLFFLCDVPQTVISEYMATFLYNTTAKVYCNCPAFKFWGYEYILTRKSSVYGPGEYRPSNEKNPHNEGVFCKHLWVVSDSLCNKKIQLANGLVPFYKRAFGLVSPSMLSKVKNETSIIKLQEIFEKSKTDADSTRDPSIKEAFHRITEQYLKDIGKKKLKEPEIQDQKRDNTEEIKKIAESNKPVMRGIEKIGNNEETILDTLEENGNEGDVQIVAE